MDGSGFDREHAKHTKNAEDVVRNGEGTTHVMRVHVSEAPDIDLARGVGKAIVNSPLFKSAVP